MFKKDRLKEYEDTGEKRDKAETILALTILVFIIISIPLLLIISGLMFFFVFQNIARFSVTRALPEIIYMIIFTLAGALALFGVRLSVRWLNK